MAFKAKILVDSINENGNRLTTFQLTYPRIVHSEMLTHRVFSRNSSSSRAIPVKKMLSDVSSDPFMPVYWGKNQSGMQARVELEGDALKQAKENWLIARDQSVSMVEKMVDLGLHKQIANRLLEPWMWITVIYSSTEYDNFFKLRCHEDAQPEVHKIADMAYDLFHNSKPTKLKVGEWHLPFISNEEKESLTALECCKVSIGRCARVSYLTHEGIRDTAADVELCERLINFSHFSPTEHVATPQPVPHSEGNFYGWSQFRKSLPNESVEDFVRPY